MSAFATLYALEKLHGCKIFFAQYQKDYLLDYFRFLFVHILAENKVTLFGKMGNYGCVNKG